MKTKELKNIRKRAYYPKSVETFGLTIKEGVAIDTRLIQSASPLSKEKLEEERLLIETMDDKIERISKIT